MPSIVERNCRLVNALALPNGICQFVDVSNHGQAFSAREIVAVGDAHNFFSDSITNPKGAISSFRDFFAGRLRKETPGQTTAIYPAFPLLRPDGLRFRSTAERLFIAIISRIYRCERRFPQH